MIKRIFFDLDETLLHTVLGEHPGQTCYMHENVSYIRDTPYFTIFRPDANDLIQFARDLVGKENVYILTAAIREYAIILNDAGGFGFSEDRIFAREDQEKYSHRSNMYGSIIYAENKEISDENNVLIDNLSSRYNEGKCSFIGMKDYHNYIKVNDYYGANCSWVAKETMRIKEDIKTIYDKDNT